MTTQRPVFLHIGAVKTGTTYLQSLMFANRDPLADAGVLLPGATWGRQVRAVQDVLRLSRRDEHIRRQSRGAWKTLLDEVHETGHRSSVVSMEYLGSAGPGGVRRVVGSFADDDLHVVITVRDMVRVLPAIWQTLVHNGATFTWEEFLDAALTWQPGSGALADLVVPWLGGPRSWLRRTVDVPRILHRWAPVVPRGHLHVVTVPRGSSDPMALWRRFAHVIGVEPTSALEKPEDDNASIGYASTELVRQVNRTMARVSRSEYNWTVKEHLALDVLAERSGLEDRAGLTEAAYDRALGWNAAIREAVREVGAHVVGDLDDLPVEPETDIRAKLPAEPHPAPPEQMLEAAEVALRGLDALRARRLRRLTRLGAHPEPLPHPAADGALERWRTETDPVGTAVREVAARCDELALLLREVRRVKAAHA